jgi:chromosome segregation ATPase
VARDKNTFFEQLQLRQAELESAQAHADTLQHQNTELEFQLRETNDRLALVREEYAELQREAESRSREPTVSAEEIARMVSTTEAKYEARLTEMKRKVSVLEKERHESEADWSRKLKEKVGELDDLKSMLGSATRMRESEENTVASLKTGLESALDTNKSLRREIAELTLLKGQIEELQVSSDFQKK